MSYYIEIAASREVCPDPKSKLVMQAIGADYSHVLIIFNRGNGEEVFHATGKGVHTMLLSDFMKDHVIAHRKKVEMLCDPQYFYGYIKGANGKAYGTDQLLGTEIDLAKPLGNNNEERMICSELCAEVLEHMCGVTVFGEEDNDFVNPRDVIESL